MPTVFIGGNHEASNHLWEAYYGGYLAKNIAFLGYSGSLLFGKRRSCAEGSSTPREFIRIGGMSGIYKSNDYDISYCERLPYGEGHLRSMYHIRSFEIFKMRHLKCFVDSQQNARYLDAFLSHDWPLGITRFGDEEALLRRK